MKKGITFTVVAVVGTLAILATQRLVGQGPTSNVSHHLETQFSGSINKPENNGTEDSVTSQETNTLVLNNQEPSRGRGLMECPDRETMLGLPITSIECYLYKEYFDEAYELYPNIPRGVLEVVASMNGRGLVHITEDDFEYPWDAHDVPRTYTVMGYYDLPGYEPNYNNLSLVSSLSGYTKTQIIQSPRISILAYAKVFSEKIIENNIAMNDWVALGNIVVGLDQFNSSDTRFAEHDTRLNFLWGMSNHELANAFSFPLYEIDIEEVIQVSQDGNDQEQNIATKFKNLSSPEDSLLFLSGGSSSVCNHYPYLDGDVVIPACNYGVRNSGATVDKIAIHTIEGSVASAHSWFQMCASGVSAHYLSGTYPDTTSSNKVIQAVCEPDKAYHIGAHNSVTIGIEHGGEANQTKFASSFYQESANLVLDIANRYANINARATYSGPAHGVTHLLHECVDIKGHQHFDISMNSTPWKYDPGDTWDWYYYYGLINNSIDATYTASSGSFFDPGGQGGDYIGLDYRTYRINPGFQNVVLDISQFNLGSGDYVWIYDEPFPTIEPNPHNNTTENGMGPDAPNDVPIGNFLTGSFLDLPQTSFTSSQGGFYVVFRSDCNIQDAGFAISWSPGVACSTDSYEPNNTQAASSGLGIVGSGVYMAENLSACIDDTQADHDWYEMMLLEPGLLTVTLSSPSNLIDIASDPNTAVTTLPNGDKTFTFCHNGLSCYPVSFHVWQQFSGLLVDPNYNVEIIWNPLVSCIPNNLSTNTSTPKSGSTGLALSNVVAHCSNLAIGAMVSNGAGPYDWYIDGQYVASGNVLNHNVSATGVYTILVVDRGDQCKSAWDEVSVSLSSINVSIAPPSATITSGGGVQLFASGGSSYSWFPSIGLSDPSVWNPIASPTTTTTYTVSATDPNGCVGTDDITVQVGGSPTGSVSNNTPCTAEILSIGLNTCSYTTGSNLGATNSGVTVDPLCANTSISGNPIGSYAGGDVWYKVQVPSSGMVIINTQQQSLLGDAVVAAYTGASCSALNMIACADDQGPTNFMPTMTLVGLSPNTWLYIRVWEFGNDVFGDFGICAMTPYSGSGTTSLPNFELSSLAVSDLTPGQGDNVTIGVTITNTGSIGSSSCYYVLGLADDMSGNLVTGGFMGIGAVPVLLPGQGHTLNLMPDIPTNISDDTYYLVVSIDYPFDQVSETNDSDNVIGQIVTVGNVVPTGVDLDVTMRYISDLSPQPGEQWTVGIEVQNDGNQESPGTTALIVLSDDTDYDPGVDQIIWETNIHSLDPGEDDYDEYETIFPIVSHVGTWYVLFIADAYHQVAEIDESNNVDDRFIIVNTITPVTPDYVSEILWFQEGVSNTPIVGDTVSTGIELEVIMRTYNYGYADGQNSASTRARIVPQLPGDGMQLLLGYNGHPASGIDPGDYDPGSPDEVLGGVQTGLNYLVIETDYKDEIYEGESGGEDNNFLVHPIYIQHNGLVADIVPRILSVSPYSNALGDEVIVTTRVYNYGDTTAYDFLLRHWLSMDPVFDGKDFDAPMETALGYIDSLLPGDSIDITRTLLLEHEPQVLGLTESVGQRYVLAVIDELCKTVIESNVMNNVSSMPLYIDAVDCYTTMQWSGNSYDDTLDWDQTFPGYVRVNTADDCRYDIWTSDWLLSPGLGSYTNWKTFFMLASQNLTGYDRTGCLYTSDGDSLCFVQKAAPTIPLPVTWINVDVYEFEGNALVYWRVGVEYNVNRYVVERSFDGINFLPIGSVQPFNADNSTYRYSDQLHNHDVYYRVVAQDYDGATNVSDIVTLQGFRPESQKYEILPTNVGYTLESFGRTKYQLLNTLGQVVVSGVCDPAEICDIQYYQSGIYFLHMNIFGNHYVEKLLF